MTRLFTALAFCCLIASCGADGAPTPPKVTGGTTVSMNSNSGVSTSTSIGLVFGSN
ncbi:MULTISPECIES: argininosuccinate lyase [Pacificibacter]|uniref:argininosuccinate lyase n=1 Tax=Pacificibacter TaxID=1042323 RepID=UPI001C093CA8|nr:MULTISPECIES: argininosuccinate lyase [Pacificibacter]MBU2937873.1 argininosuccinate lyase [Pacificibacter marinus]MDO6617245.1 argininosuccinate lyase [Pacificibacter sp. 1_MG-2023]